MDSIISERKWRKHAVFSTRKSIHQIAVKAKNLMINSVMSMHCNALYENFSIEKVGRPSKIRQAEWWVINRSLGAEQSLIGLIQAAWIISSGYPLNLIHWILFKRYFFEIPSKPWKLSRGSSRDWSKGRTGISKRSPKPLFAFSRNFLGTKAFE